MFSIFCHAANKKMLRGNKPLRSHIARYAALPPLSVFNCWKIADCRYLDQQAGVGRPSHSHACLGAWKPLLRAEYFKESTTSGWWRYRLCWNDRCVCGARPGRAGGGGTAPLANLLAGRRSHRDGGGHLVDALHRDAGFSAAGSYPLPLPDGDGVVAGGDWGVGSSVVHGQPQTHGCGSVVAGGLIMGGGISALHYIGMAAMRLPGSMEFLWSRVGLSVALAVTMSMAGLMLTFRFRSSRAPAGPS